jgi:hypothetical protein
MTTELIDLIEQAKSRRISSDDLAKQRISFAFGNGLEDADVVSEITLLATDKIIRSKLGPKKR